MARHRPPAPHLPARWLRIRVPVVIAERCAQHVATLDVPLPFAIARRQDGSLAAAPRAEQAGPPVVQAAVLDDKVLVEGRLPLDLIAADPDPEPCPGSPRAARRRVVLPFALAVDLPGARAGDAAPTRATVEALTVATLPAPALAPGKKAAAPLGLRVTAVLRVCVQVERVKVVTIRCDP